LGLVENGAKGLLLISYISPVELSTDRYLHKRSERVVTSKARRAVFDSLTSMQLGVPSERRFKELVYSLSKHMRAANVTLVMTMEGASTARCGGTVRTRHLVYAVTCYACVHRGRRQLERGISILKARGIKQPKRRRLLRIGHRG